MRSLFASSSSWEKLSMASCRYFFLLEHLLSLRVCVLLAGLESLSWWVPESLASRLWEVPLSWAVLRESLFEDSFPHLYTWLEAKPLFCKETFLKFLISCPLGGRWGKREHGRVKGRPRRRHLPNILRGHSRVGSWVCGFGDKRATRKEKALYQLAPYLPSLPPTSKVINSSPPSPLQNTSMFF